MYDFGIKQWFAYFVSGWKYYLLCDIQELFDSHSEMAHAGSCLWLMSLPCTLVEGSALWFKPAAMKQKESCHLWEDLVNI